MSTINTAFESVSYIDRLKNLGRKIGFCYLGAFVAGIILSALLGFFPQGMKVVIDSTLGFTIFLGSIACIFCTMKMDHKPFLISAGLHALDGLRVAIIGSFCSLNPVIIVLGLGVAILAFIPLCAFAAIAICTFPLTLAYLTVMSVVEKFGRLPDETACMKLDKLVPTAASILGVGCLLLNIL